MQADKNWISNLYVKDVGSASAASQTTDLPNVYFSGVSWNSDGTSILFSTWTTRETRQVARFRVSGNMGSDRGKNDVTLIGPKNEALTLASVSPDGGYALMTGENFGVRGLWRVSVESDELSDLTLIVRGGRISSSAITNDGRFAYVRNGALFAGSVDEAPKKIPVTAAFEIDPAQKRVSLFREATLTLRDYFADATISDNDWDDLYQRFAPFVAGAENNHDFMIAARMMIGELNASHTNIWGDDQLEYEAVGDLGVDFLPAKLAAGEYEVTKSFEVESLRPAVITAGSRLLTLGGVRLDSSTNIHELLRGGAGKAIEAEILTPDGVEHVAMLPVYSSQQVAKARYEAWVEKNAQLVNTLSEDRYGYIHLQHIGWGATEGLRNRLGASTLTKDGLLIDIRNNGGGVEATRLLSLLERRSDVRTQYRDVIDAPAPLVHGIPFLGLPTALVQNEQTLSNAEIFSHDFRKLNVGPVVGVRTAGWVKGQRGYKLFDGTRMSVGAFDAVSSDGEVFDAIGRAPDITADRSPAESLTSEDSQLAAAVAALDRVVRKSKRKGAQ